MFGVDSDEKVRFFDFIIVVFKVLYIQLLFHTMREAVLIQIFQVYTFK